MKRSLVALTATCMASVAAMSHAAPHEQVFHRTTPTQTPLVTAVEGPSNFHRLGIEFDSSGMGRTGVIGP